MTFAETVLACCVVGLACFIGGEAVGARRTVHDEAGGTIARRTAPASSAADTTSPVLSGSGSGVVMRHGEEVLVAGPATPARNSATAARRRLESGMSGTYIGQLLAARDSAIARWPDRVTRPLRVFVRDGDELEAWNPDFLPAVRDAFDTWTQAGIPVRFSFVRDSATADIHVQFVDAFANGISGKTVWSRDGAHWLMSSDIQLAVTHPHGGTVTPPQMRAIALHEVGHLLGLDHSDSADDIMAARVRVRELSEADRATVRLVYAVPAGSIKR
jgi:predicted Zn-dependent protease